MNEEIDGTGSLSTKPEGWVMEEMHKGQTIESVVRPRKECTSKCGMDSFTGGGVKGQQVGKGTGDTKYNEKAKTVDRKE